MTTTSLKDTLKKLREERRREFFVKEQVCSNLALVRDGSEKYPDDINGKPNEQWAHVTEVTYPDRDTLLSVIEFLSDCLEKYRHIPIANDEFNSSNAKSNQFSHAAEALTKAKDILEKK
jgi:hypothetical protein